MDGSTVMRRLRQVGARAELRDGAFVVDGRPALIEFKRNRLPERTALERASSAVASRSDSPLLVVVAPRASDASISWAAAHSNSVTLVLDDLVVHRGLITHLGESQPTPASKRGPKPYARHAVGRTLLSGASRSDQLALAELAGATQGSVSTALRAFGPDIIAGDLFDSLVANYPGPGGQTFYWWSDRPVREQADILRSCGALTSGDFAADELAPWRVSEHAVGYAREPIDLAKSGFVLAAEDDFTTMLVVPRDPTIWATAGAWGASGVADPVIAAIDVQRTATTGDGDEAVAQLREFAVRRFEARAHG